MNEPNAPRAALSATDFHVLLVLAERDLYGYALLQAVEAESGGAVSPDIGSLYRVGPAYFTTLLPLTFCPGFLPSPIFLASSLRLAAYFGATIG